MEKKSEYLKITGRFLTGKIALETTCDKNQFRSKVIRRPCQDPNTGAHSYGWHGAHVRVTALGMALLDDLDTGVGHVT